MIARLEGHAADGEGLLTGPHEVLHRRHVADELVGG